VKASKITAVDFFEDLSSPFARKRFFWGFAFFAALCIVVLLLVRSYPMGFITEIIDSIAIELLTGILIILAFYFIYTYFIGPNLGYREVTPVRSQDIKIRMEQLPDKTNHYTFWGRSGSYFRSVPLLKLNEQALKEKLITDIEIVLPDPNDARLIESYNEILRSLQENDTGNRLLANVLATTIACAIVGANNKYLRIKIFYSKFLPAFRIDMSSNGAILTQDDRSKSALFFEAGSEFHEMFRTTVRNEMAVSREVTWDAAIFKGLSLEEKSCNKKTLEAFGIELRDIGKLQQEVASLIAKPSHRYK
jgi:hypothetical protein